VHRAHRLRRFKIKNQADTALQVAQFGIAEILHRTPPSGRITVVGELHLVGILGLVIALRVKVPSVGDRQLAAPGGGERSGAALV
jgi:hypothetical protein